MGRISDTDSGGFALGWMVFGGVLLFFGVLFAPGTFAAPALVWIAAWWFNRNDRKKQEELERAHDEAARRLAEARLKMERGDLD